MQEPKDAMSDTATPFISCRDVWKIFGRKARQYLKSIDSERSIESIHKDGYIAAVRDVSLDIFQGEILVIMGLSGSGKSTLVRCMSRLVEVTGGAVIVDGQDITGLSEPALIELRRSRMGMVFQSFGLLPHRTVLNNVAFPLEMRGQDRATRHRRALEVIELVGLSGREGHYPRELSGGQQQRVGIARSLAVEPEIWFLDEPFSALDPLIRREMQEEFLRLQRILSKTIVFITHDFDEALRLADRIAIMRDGVVEQCDTPQAILLDPATDYVAKFTKDVEKSRVVRVRDIAESRSGDLPAGDPIDANACLHDIGRTLFDERREEIAVVGVNGEPVGVLSRDRAVAILFGEDR